MRPTNNYHPDDCGCDICCPEADRQDHPARERASAEAIAQEFLPRNLQGKQVELEQAIHDYAKTLESSLRELREEKQDYCDKYIAVRHQLTNSVLANNSLQRENEQLKAEKSDIDDYGYVLNVARTWKEASQKLEAAEAELARCKEQLEAERSRKK